MNRRYGRDFYLDLVETLRCKIPDFCLSMDVMAGFPGEEEPHFENTLSLIGKTRPIRVHAFPYSRREGTRAARFENLPESLLRERMRRLIQCSQEVIQREKSSFLGRTLDVLVEKKSRGGFLQGHTAHYLKVAFEGPEESIGKTVRVRLEEILEEEIRGVTEETTGG